MSAPIYQTSTNNYAASTTTLTLTKPSAVKRGDMLYLLVGSDHSADETPQFTDNLTGWNLEIAEGNKTARAWIGVFSRLADGTEGATESVVAADANNLLGLYIHVRNVEISDPTHVIGTVSSNDANLTAQTATSLTTTINNCLVISFIHSQDSSLSPMTTATSGWSMIENVTGTTGAMSIATRELVTAGVSGDMVFTFNTPNANRSKAIQFALAPHLNRASAMMVGSSF